MTTPSGSRFTATILVIEDDAEVRRLAVRALERAGFVALSAGCPDEAITIAKRAAHIDVLVTDVVLPTMSGISAATEIRRFRPSLPILFMSGYPVDAVAGATDFISKPFLPSDLVAAVDGILARTALL
jgi:CheY-like chemotaxis protein